MNRYLDTIQHPWSRKDIETAIFKKSLDALAAIEDTDGGKLWRSLHDLEDTIWIFETATTELLDEIHLFAERSKDGLFWIDTNASACDLFIRTVKRKLFNCTHSLMALVDHARNFQKCTPVNDYNDYQQTAFSVPGLHDFLQGLRNYNTHWRIAQAHWNISYNHLNNTREARFKVAKTELLLWKNWNKKALAYISQTPGSVDIYDVFTTYKKQVQDFYSWHRSMVLDTYAEILQPYFQYKRLYSGLQKKYHWNLIISHIPKKTNPYKHLSKYISNRDIELLLSFPHRSEAQVDALIHMLNMEDFCDENLRKKILALFLYIE